MAALKAFLCFSWQPTAFRNLIYFIHLIFFWKSVRTRVSSHFGSTCMRLEGLGASSYVRLEYLDCSLKTNPYFRIHETEPSTVPAYLRSKAKSRFGARFAGNQMDLSSRVSFGITFEWRFRITYPQTSFQTHTHQWQLPWLSVQFWFMVILFHGYHACVYYNMDMKCITCYGNHACTLPWLSCVYCVLVAMYTLYLCCHVHIVSWLLCVIYIAVIIHDIVVIMSTLYHWLYHRTRVYIINWLCFYYIMVIICVLYYGHHFYARSYLSCILCL